MKKSELIELIAQNADIPKTSAAKALNATLSAITESLSHGEEVVISGFGTFKVGHRAERAGRNPSTGEAITIKAAKVPQWKAGKAVKDAVNQ